MPSFRTPEVILFSEDVERAASFYSSLGFVETFRVPVEGDPIHVDLTLDGYKIGIASVASSRRTTVWIPFRPASEQRSSSGPTTPLRPWRKSTAMGAPELAAPREWLGRLLIAWTADPDGNPIQIVQQL